MTKNPAIKELETYMTEYRHSMLSFGISAGFSGPTIGNYLSGKTEPTVSGIKAIAKATNGRVKPSLWFKEENK